MSVERKIQPRNGKHPEQFIDRLYNEWEHPQDDPNAPRIIEEAPSLTEQTNHLYVIWDEWSDLTPLERSKVVIRAYERHAGRDSVSAVTLAMGLTSTEAERLKIAY